MKTPPAYQHPIRRRRYADIIGDFRRLSDAIMITARGSVSLATREGRPIMFVRLQCCHNPGSTCGVWGTYLGYQSLQG